MGGRSKSRTSNSNKQTTHNIANDGEFAGAKDFVNDERDYDDSFNNNGEFAGSSGDITVLDGGAIEESAETSREAISAVEGIAIKTVDGSNKAAEQALKVADNTLDRYTEFNAGALALLGNQSEEFREGLSDQATTFAGELSKNAELSETSRREILQTLEKNAAENNRAVADLAKTTSLGGQDVVADSVVKVSKFFLLMAVVGGVVYLYANRKQSVTVVGMSPGMAKELKLGNNQFYLEGK